MPAKPSAGSKYAAIAWPRPGAVRICGDVDARYDPEVIAFMYTGIGNFIGMRWADWTAGGQVPDDVLDDLLEVLRRGLPPAGPPR